MPWASGRRIARNIVCDVLKAMDSDGTEAVVTPKGGMPWSEALTRYFDLNRPTSELLQHFAKTNAELRALLAPERKDDLKKWLWGRGVIDLLVENPGVKFSAPELAALLKPLAPRLYSIASSPKAHAGQVHLTVSVVRYDSFGRRRKTNGFHLSRRSRGCGNARPGFYSNLPWFPAARRRQPP